MADETKTEEEVNPLRDLRVKLVKLHQLSARIRTNANLVSDKAGQEESFLKRESTPAAVEKAIKQLEGIEQDLAAILTLR